MSTAIWLHSYSSEQQLETNERHLQVSQEPLGQVTAGESDSMQFHRLIRLWLGMLAQPALPSTLESPLFLSVFYVYLQLHWQDKNSRLRGFEKW